MRAAFFILAILFGFTSVSSAAEDDKTKKLKEKPISIAIA